MQCTGCKRLSVKDVTVVATKDTVEADADADFFEPIKLKGEAARPEWLRAREDDELYEHEVDERAIVAKIVGAVNDEQRRL